MECFAYATKKKCVHQELGIEVYTMSKKFCPYLYRCLVYKNGQEQEQQIMRSCLPIVFYGWKWELT